MNHPPLTDPLAKAFAAAMRDAYRCWRRFHPDPDTDAGDWGPDVSRLELTCHYHPGGTGFVAVSVVSRRPGRSDVHSFVLTSQSGEVRLARHAAKS